MSDIQKNPFYDKTYKNALAEYNDPVLADTLAKIAVSAVQRKSQTGEMFFYITKASIIDDEMVISATASNTGLDAYQERMSLDLYKSFIARFRGEAYISLAHYPDGEGETSLGEIKTLYIDGDKLKMKARFYENPLGIAAFNSIKKDRRDNVPHEKRVRISIGFYDFGHNHGEDKTWSIESGHRCSYCKLGVKNKTYTDGYLEHAALTRKPAVEDADIDEE